MSLEFTPGRRPPGPDCIDRHVYGQDSTLYSYILKEHILPEDQYPPEACTPYKHSTAQIDSLQVNVSIIGNGFINVLGNINSGTDVTCPGHRLSSKKNFDIPHPTKEGWRLRHTCLEGPENAVYFRGRLKGNNEIELPDYWQNFVDPESITVSLTQIGSSQDLIVDEVALKSIIIRSGNDSSIDCYYLIHGERSDGEKLIVEYEGETPMDYPGNNSEYSVSGYHYDVKEGKK